MSSVWRDWPGLGGLTGGKVVLLFGDQRRKSGGYSISENNPKFESATKLVSARVRIHKDINVLLVIHICDAISKRHLWQTGVSARVRIHTKETAMPARYGG